MSGPTKRIPFHQVDAMLRDIIVVRALLNVGAAAALPGRGYPVDGNALAVTLQEAEERMERLQASLESAEVEVSRD